MEVIENDSASFLLCWLCWLWPKIPWDLCGRNWTAWVNILETIKHRQIFFYSNQKPNHAERWETKEINTFLMLFISTLVLKSSESYNMKVKVINALCMLARKYGTTTQDCFESFLSGDQIEWIAKVELISIKIIWIII